MPAKTTTVRNIHAINATCDWSIYPALRLSINYGPRSRRAILYLDPQDCLDLARGLQAMRRCLRHQASCAEGRHQSLCLALNPGDA